MSDVRFRFESLGDHHDRAAFACGVEGLDRYLKLQAGQERRRRFAVTYVLHDADAGLIVGYYTLSTAAIPANRLPPELTKRLPRYADVPAFLLGRLAVDARYRGEGMGQRLLLDAASRALGLTDHVGAALVVVDAIDADAHDFY